MKNDTLKILLVFLATVLLVYGMPRMNMPILLNQIIFLLIIVYIYNSKDNVFWLVWYFAVVNAPGRLFIGGLAENIYRLPVYTVAPGIAFGFEDLFVLMYILKAFNNKTHLNFVFKREIWLVIIMALFYFVISFALGISYSNMIRTTRLIMPWLWVLIVPRYVNDDASLRRAFLLLVPIMIIAFLTLLQTYFTGQYLHHILSGHLSSRMIQASEESFARVYSSANINVVCLILSLYFLALKNSMLNPNLLILVAILGSLSIFLSGTRGWILVLILLYSSFFFVSGYGFFKQFVRIGVIIGVLVLILSVVYPLIFAQGSLSYQRFTTLEYLASGDLTAGGTLSRLTERGPKVMAVWRESPVIGWGFSDKFHAYADGHVGNQTNLLNFGILGFLLINFIYLVIIVKTFQLGRNQMARAVRGNSYGVFIFALLGLFIAHSSSGMLWGFATVSHSGYLLWAFLFSAINAELNPSKLLQKS
jgi:hypothetical protein